MSARCRIAACLGLSLLACGDQGEDVADDQPSPAAGPCEVRSEDDDGGEITTFRHRVERTNLGVCTVGAVDRPFFSAGIAFQTTETLPAGYLGDDIIETIVLGDDADGPNVLIRRNDPVVFDDPFEILVIGNHGIRVTEDETREIPYQPWYIEDLTDSRYEGGTVTIDGRTNFDAGVAPIRCKYDNNQFPSQSVYFRQVTLLTNGVAREDLDPCFLNAGGFVVDPGD